MEKTRLTENRKPKDDANDDDVLIIEDPIKENNEDISEADLRKAILELNTWNK